jgi:hypothetical protein
MGFAMGSFRCSLRPSRRDHARDGDAVQVGGMDGAPGARLCRRPGFQIGQIGAAVPPHPAGRRTGQGVEPGGAERLPAHPTKSLSSRHM